MVEIFERNGKFGYMEVKGDPDKIFFTSDAHHFHKNIIRLCGRPYSCSEEMTEKLIGNWNSIVPEDGLVFNLGDFCWTGSADVWNELLDRLNGQQVFIRGNHDNAKCLEKVRERFVDVRERLEIRYEDERFMLDHYPQVSWNGAAHAVRLLHGHLHEQDFQYATSSTYNVSLERNGYRPISMSEVYDILTVQHRENKVNLRLNNLFYNDNMY